MSLQSEIVSNSVEAQVQALLLQMTLAEKIGQMTQIEKNSLQPEDVTNYHLGSVLSGGGGNPTPNNAQSWADMVRPYQEAALKSRLGIPLLYGADAVHGHNNVVGATIFPHNIGLGATQDEALVQETAKITAHEMLATGVQWDFAPAVPAPQDVRWGRIYEGFSEDPDLVTRLSRAYIRGLQEMRVMPSVKHFIGDGAAEWGTTPPPIGAQADWQAATSRYKIDQGDTAVDEATLRSKYLKPYIAALEEGVMNIMASHSSWQGLKMHAHHYLLTTVLKEELGFKGFVVSDWMGINYLSKDYSVAVVTAINAGIDMVMVPYDFKLFTEVMTAAVEKGEISQARIDDAVTRILRAKFWLGLFENPFGHNEYLPEVGSAEHRAVAREAVRKSLVLLKNDNNALPLPKAGRIVVAGGAADDIGLQCGGWTISWQGESGKTTEGTSLLEALRKVNSAIEFNPAGDFEGKAEIGVVVVAETPYAEGLGDQEDMNLPAEHAALIEKMRGKCDKLVVILFSGRPLVITDALAQVDAWVMAWLPGTEGDGMADVFFGDHPFVGKSAFSWPRSTDYIALADLQQNPAERVLFPRGHGVTY
jgi:beta-glucosidase